MGFPRPGLYTLEQGEQPASVDSTSRDYIVYFLLNGYRMFYITGFHWIIRFLYFTTFLNINRSCDIGIAASPTSQLQRGAAPAAPRDVRWRGSCCPI